MKTLNWGIIGCGRIAAKFARGLQTLKGCRLVAAASLSEGKAERFAVQFGIPRFYTDYETLVRDPDIHIVYIASLHNAHCGNTLLALNNGKHVLCEKPFALNGDQAQQMAEAARSNDLFLMEAMWTRFLPASRKLKRLIDEGGIGEVKHLRAEFGFHVPWDPDDRLHSLPLSGGSLLDLGIYPVSYARWIFGCDPESIQSTADIGRSGVDEQSSYFFSYPGGRSAHLFSSFKVRVQNEALIAGSEGYVRVPNFFHPHKFTVRGAGLTSKKYRIPYRSTGLQYQAEEAMACVRAGKNESPVMPLNESVEIMRTLDALRRQWGLVYPEERNG
ncbi:MAG: Gfo/Idh/MocA family oxidoreductase [Acidobacteria bacterium]|nr:Gfo/Idh/MocA family oxidoreductase [Acidobacteriota bacterium]MBU4494978.1 Gfo/Idh/MocA family oxidoreductase [Acidobacteriota bacterium]